MTHALRKVGTSVPAPGRLDQMARSSPANVSAGSGSGSPSGVRDVGLPQYAFTAPPAGITGTGADLQADAPATVLGASVLPPALQSAESFTINGTTVNLTAGMTPTQVVEAINTANGGNPPPGLARTRLDPGNHLVLTSADAKSAITVAGSAPGLGLADGTTNPTNLLTQGAVSAGQTLVITVGSNDPLTITFGTDPNEVSTLADLQNELKTMVGGTASVDASGNVSITAANPADTIAVTGTASPAAFGIHTTTAVPPNGGVLTNGFPNTPNTPPTSPNNEIAWPWTVSTGGSGGTVPGMSAQTGSLTSALSPTMFALRTEMMNTLFAMSGDPGASGTVAQNSR
jgi:hypothetical protein